MEQSRKWSLGQPIFGSRPITTFHSSLYFYTRERWGQALHISSWSCQCLCFLEWNLLWCFHLAVTTFQNTFFLLSGVAGSPPEPVFTFSACFPPPPVPLSFLFFLSFCELKAKLCQIAPPACSALLAFLACFPAKWNHYMHNTNCSTSSVITHG